MRVAFAVALVAGVGCGRADASAGTGHDARRAAPDSPVIAAAARASHALRPIALEDTALLDQHGARVRLVTDVLGDATAVVNFVYTRCTTVCSPMTATMVKAQMLLVEGGVTDVRFASFTLDPVADTPERLNAFLTPYEPHASFSFLTGERTTVEQVTRALQGSLGVKEAHAPVFVVGSARTGEWVRVYGLVSARRLADEVLKTRARLRERERDRERRNHEREP